MRNNDAEKQLREAWNRHLDNYEKLLKIYKSLGYKIKRNDKTGDHIVEKQEQNPFNTGNLYGDIFGYIFKGGRP